MEEEEEEQDTSIKGRLLALLYKIKGPPQKTEEEPTETEQAAPSEYLGTWNLKDEVVILNNLYHLPHLSLNITLKQISNDALPGAFLQPSVSGFNIFFLPSFAESVVLFFVK